jgi:hypothetical protein
MSTLEKSIVMIPGEEYKRCRGRRASPVVRSVSGWETINWLAAGARSAYPFHQR